MIRRTTVAACHGLRQPPGGRPRGRERSPGALCCRWRQAQALTDCRDRPKTEAAADCDMPLPTAAMTRNRSTSCAEGARNRASSVLTHGRKAHHLRGLMSIFAIPKEEEPVRVRLETGLVLEGHIFLEITPFERSKQQRMASFLEEGGNFFPFLITGAGTTIFINMESVLSVEAGYVEPDPLKHITPMIIEEVTATFTVGGEISGVLLAEVPVEQSRLSDCLNLPYKFLTIRADDIVYYINKKMVQKITSPGKKGG